MGPWAALAAEPNMECNMELVMHQEPPQQLRIACYGIEVITHSHFKLSCPACTPSRYAPVAAYRSPEAHTLLLLALLRAVILSSAAGSCWRSGTEALQVSGNIHAPDLFPRRWLIGTALSGFLWLQ